MYLAAAGPRMDYSDPGLFCSAAELAEREQLARTTCAAKDELDLPCALMRDALSVTRPSHIKMNVESNKNEPHERTSPRPSIVEAEVAL